MVQERSSTTKSNNRYVWHVKTKWWNAVMAVSFCGFSSAVIRKQVRVYLKMDEWMEENLTVQPFSRTKSLNIHPKLQTAIRNRRHYPTT